MAHNKLDPTKHAIYESAGEAGCVQCDEQVTDADQAVVHAWVVEHARLIDNGD